MRASAAGIGGPTCLTKVLSEGTNPCTQSSFATKNVFDVVQYLSESIGDHVDRSWKLQMGCLSPLTTTCTSR